MTWAPRAPVAQGIEHRPPEAVAQVRILPGALCDLSRHRKRLNLRVQPFLLFWGWWSRVSSRRSSPVAALTMRVWRISSCCTRVRAISASWRRLTLAASTAMPMSTVGGCRVAGHMGRPTDQATRNLAGADTAGVRGQYPLSTPDAAAICAPSSNAFPPSSTVRSRKRWQPSAPRQTSCSPTWSRKRHDGAARLEPPSRKPAPIVVAIQQCSWQRSPLDQPCRRTSPPESGAPCNDSSSDTTAGAPCTPPSSSAPRRSTY